MSIVKDMNLAESGRRKIHWVRDHMPALSQIEDKGYAFPYQADKRTVFRIGASFDSEKRMLTGWIVR